MIQQAIKDKENLEPKNFGLREYMDATKIVNTLRLEHDRVVGNEWIAQKAAELGLETTESGIAYKAVTIGKGKECWEGCTVRVHYTGKLMDGTVFDSSYDRGEAAVFPQNAVIEGWQEGLKLMTVGSKYHFYIPENLAYGDRGAGSDIPPYAALFFEVELLSVL